MDEQKTNTKFIAIIVVGFLALVALVTLSILVVDSHKKNTATEQQLAEQQRSLASSAYADPLLKYLPYGGQGYNINPVLKTINNKYVLSLTVTIILSGADYNSPPDILNTAINDRKQAALDYIRSKGLDPAKYNISFVVPTH